MIGSGGTGRSLLSSSISFLFSLGPHCAIGDTLLVSIAVIVAGCTIAPVLTCGNRAIADVAETLRTVFGVGIV